MRRKNINVLKQEFEELLQDESNLESYLIYYQALVSWTKSNWIYFPEKIKEEKDFKTLLNIDPIDYLADNQELSLKMERKRLESLKYKKIEDLAWAIKSTLWDLVVFRSGKDCPVCIDDELRYVVVENQETLERQIGLNCFTCNWMETTEGHKWESKVNGIFPANRKDVEDMMKKNK